MLIQHDERQKLAFIEKEMRLAEWEIAQIREQYGVFSPSLSTNTKRINE